jgi:tetratricopeptide (TPR) repeat protein
MTVRVVRCWWIAVAVTAVVSSWPARSSPWPAGVAHAQAEDEEGQLLIEEARRAIGKKDYARAGDLLDQALRVSPRRIDVYVLRASVHGVLKEHAKGVAVLERAHKLAPDNQSVSTALGIQLVHAGAVDRGVPILEKVVAAHADRYDAQVVLGHHYVAQAMWTEAVSAFAAYFAARPSQIAREDHLHQIDYANAQLRSGDPRAARKLYEDVLARRKDSEAARLGVAWSAAAIDCRDALPIFETLGDLEAKYGEVSLVRGRCALLLGRLDDALAAAERYRKAATTRAGDGAGWVLLGDVHTAKQNHAAAETAYQRAIDADPADKVSAFKLGRSERLLGKVEQAVRRLRATGPPRDFEDDWTLEYGEALLALGDAAAVRDHLSAWVDAHPDDATGRFLFGAALARLGEPGASVPHLERAHQRGEPRARRPLVDALNTLAAASIHPPQGAADLGGARTLLERAEAVGDDVLTWRNLGAVLIAQGDAAAATAVLRKAVDQAKDDPVALHLLARAYAAAKQYDEARGAFTRAIRAYAGDRRRVSAQLDLAHAELASGRGEQAVDALDAAIAAAPDAATQATLSAALVAAARQAATDAMRGGRFGSAARVLKQADKRTAGSDDANAVRCDLALAATGQGQREAALEHLRRLDKAKARCPFVAPADELAVPILIAWNEGATLRKARQALERLDKIRSRARGVAEPLARMAARDIALRAAQEAYGDGHLKQAGKFLADARLYDKKSPEVVHNLAVIALAGGDADGAIRELERIKDEVPEAYVNLGIAYDKKRNPERALEHWKRAVSLGVRHGPLKDWIDAKERIWGGP